MANLDLYCIFHLNLSYSSIETSQHPDVVRCCYRPLLDRVRNLALPCGIETTGVTLERLRHLDPGWVDDLGDLIAEGLVEFVGSGYAQIIGPLVPAKVNAANLRLGNDLYFELLGVRPRLALVNEQCFSSGLVPLYADAGYEALVMEWDNPASAHPDWDPECRYRPQRVWGTNGRCLPLLWNQSIPFQKVQRYAHGEEGLADLLTYLQGHRGNTHRALCLYGNDVEVFDFRPGRYGTEATLGDRSEWQRLCTLFSTLGQTKGFEIVPPSSVLERLPPETESPPLRLTSPAVPIPTKKQHKYNVTRWAVTGRDDLGANTACWRRYKTLEAIRSVDDLAWRELCVQWSSDLRTHITNTRWAEFVTKAKRLSPNKAPAHRPETGTGKALPAPPAPTNRYVALDTGKVSAKLDTRRGLALASLAFGPHGDRPLVGTITHGHFDDISLGADFYTGHLVFEMPGRPKITDLEPCRGAVQREEGAGDVRLTATIDTPLGPITKSFTASKEKPVFTLEYELHWPTIPLGRLRLGYVTLMPNHFERSSLFYRTHNGGMEPETFGLNRPIDHGESVSFLVSAHQAIGMTEGWCDLGDRHHCIRVTVDKTTAALVGMIAYRPSGDSYLLRLALSAREMDETSRVASKDSPIAVRRFILKIEPGPDWEKPVPS